MNSVIKTHSEKEKCCSDEDVALKIRELRDKCAWYQLTIRGERGVIKELSVTEKKLFNDGQ